MGNSKTDKEVKIYKNSECEICFWDFETPLVIADVDGKKIIICKQCLKEVKK